MNLSIKPNLLRYIIIIMVSCLLMSCGNDKKGKTDDTLPDDGIPDFIPEPTTNNDNILTPDELPLLDSGTFSYAAANQKFEAENISEGSSIAVAVFKNNASTDEQDDLTITAEEFHDSTTAKKSVAAKKLKKLMEENPRYHSHKRDNFKAPYLHSKRKKNTGINKKKKNRANDAIGTRDTFFHDEGPDNGKVLDFELLFKSSKCLVYSEIRTSTDTPYVSQSRGAEIGNVFSNNNPYHKTGEPIFDTVTKAFGNPWGVNSSGTEVGNGGRDGEAPILILLFNSGASTSLFGYFYWVDEEEKGFQYDGYISNGAEIIFLNQHFANDDIDLYSTLSHEFQHLCDYNQKFIQDGSFTTLSLEDQIKYDEQAPTLFNEGKSVMSEDLCGFSLDVTENGGGKGNKFMFDMINTYRSLISVNSSSFLSWGGGSDYGKGYLFWRFIYDSYGSDVLVKAATDISLPPESIEIATGKSFDILLQEFLIALIQTESSSSNSPFKITTIDKNKTYNDTNGNSIGKFEPLSFIDGIPNSKLSNKNPYQIRLYKLLPKNGKVNFTIDNIKEDSSFSVFTTIFDE